MPTPNKHWPFSDSPWPEGFRERCEEFFADEARLEPGLDLYPEVFYTPLFFPLQRQRETEKMIRTARKVNPRVVMEIGADKGGGFYHWIKCFPACGARKAVANEIRGILYGDLFEKAFPEVEFLWSEGSSYDPEVVESVRKFLGADRFDVVFIDGDKSGTLKDFLAYSPLVRPGGLVFIHDIRDDGPKQAFETIAQTHETTTIVDTTESDEAAEREKRGEPIDGSYEHWLRHWKGQSCGVGVVHL